MRFHLHAVTFIILRDLVSFSHYRTGKMDNLVENKTLQIEKPVINRSVFQRHVGILFSFRAVYVGDDYCHYKQLSYASHKHGKTIGLYHCTT